MILEGLRSFIDMLRSLSYNPLKKEAACIDNIISLTGQPVDVLSSDPSLTERMIIMVSWNDLFTFVIMLVAILTFIDT